MFSKQVCVENLGKRPLRSPNLYGSTSRTSRISIFFIINDDETRKNRFSQHFRVRVSIKTALDFAITLSRAFSGSNAFNRSASFGLASNPWRLMPHHPSHQLGLPLVKCRAAHTVLAGNITDRHTPLLLGQHRNNLLFTKSAAFKSITFDELSFQMTDQSGLRSLIVLKNAAEKIAFIDYNGIKVRITLN